MSAVANTGYINWYTTSTGGTPIGLDGENYTGGVQTYIIPDSVFSIDLDIVGGASGLK